MSQLVECVPNFSEGRDQKKVAEIVAAAKAAGVTILDVETDADHNRCVLSFVGAPPACVAACFAVAKASARLIDLTKHVGEHPRMGAVDVIPFIPVRGITIDECAKLAEILAERIGRELQIPTYLYDRAARRPERKDLANVRKGQFEGLRDLIGKDPAREPDFGPNKIHPTAGAVAVGAREQIVNFNINLNISDMAAGKDIAKRLRASGGGLPAVRAKEIELAARRQVQISTVLTDYKTTSIATVLATAMGLCDEHKAKIVSTEIVGLLPNDALIDFSLATLQLENFKPDTQILERRLEAVGAVGAPNWREAAIVVSTALASSDPTPGGGSAAAIAGAMGCALAEMAAAVSLKSKKLDEKNRPGLEEGRKTLHQFRARFGELAALDAAAYDGVVEAMAVAKDDPSRPAKIQAAFAHAAEIPLQTAETAAAAVKTASRVADLANPSVVSDAHCAVHFLSTAAKCAMENVRINLGALKDPAVVQKITNRLEKIVIAN